MSSPAHTLISGRGILRSLTVGQLSDLAVDCRWRTVRRDCEILGLGVQTTDVHFITKGRVRVTIYSTAGREVAFRDLSAGECFGQLAAIDGEPRSATVLALNDSILGAIARDRFLRLMRDHPEVALDVTRELTSLIRDLTSRIVDSTTLTVPVRVRRELLRIAVACAGSGTHAAIAAAPTHAELANRIGATREAVTRELNQLTRAGIIRRDGRTITILDLARLEEAARVDD